MIVKVIDQARARNISTIGCTMSPVNNSGEYADGQPRDALRAAVSLRLIQRQWLST
jgi:hypothetical protein